MHARLDGADRCAGELSNFLDLFSLVVNETNDFAMNWRQLRQAFPQDVASLADRVLSLNCRAEFPDEYRPALDVMFGQLLGLFASSACGLKPDQPSPTGAITRVVSPIRLYS